MLLTLYDHCACKPLLDDNCVDNIGSAVTVDFDFEKLNDNELDELLLEDIVVPFPISTPLEKLCVIPKFIPKLEVIIITKSLLFDQKPLIEI